MTTAGTGTRQPVTALARASSYAARRRRPRGHRPAEDLPEVAELDLNPVLAGPDGIVAVDAELRVPPIHAEPDPFGRRSRPAAPQ
jgi:ATP-grasp domain